MSDTLGFVVNESQTERTSMRRDTERVKVWRMTEKLVSLLGDGHVACRKQLTLVEFC